MKRSEKRNVEYEPSLVTYLDILGFRNLIEHRSAGYISRTLRLVRDAVKPDSLDAKAYSLHYQSFSDLIVITIPLSTQANLVYRPGALFSELLALVHAQTSLIGERILIRGALSVGFVVKSYGQLYGPALVRAYELERHTAQYPRIIIDREVLDQLKTNPALRRHDYRYEKKSIDALVTKDVDGLTFVDYLRAIESEFDYPEEEYLSFLVEHKKVVQAGFTNESDTRIREKYAT